MLIVRGLLLSNLLVYWEMTKKKFLENFQANFQMLCITQPQKQLQQYGNNLKICAHSLVLEIIKQRSQSVY